MNEKGPCILVIENEPAICRFLSTLLQAHEYSVLEAHNATEALSAVSTASPDLTVLDLTLPDLEGVQATRLLRQWTDIPIIVLSERDTEEDKVAALDAGADDYVTMPFGAPELLARLRAALRRTTQPSVGPIFAVGELRVDLTARAVKIAQQEIDLTPNEYELLRVMVMSAGKVVTHRQLLWEVWGPGHEEEMHILRVNISNLRRKLEPDPTRPRFIITEPGAGYRLRADVESPKQNEEKVLTIS